MTLHVLCVGGEDHALRIPFLSALRSRGFRVSAAGTGAAVPFSKSGIEYHGYDFDRFGARIADRMAIGQLSQLVQGIRPDVVQTFDTKPNLLAPLAIRGTVPVVRTINGMGWVFSSAHLKALALRPVYLALQRLAACWTAATVFQNTADSRFFRRYRLLGNSRAVLIGSSGIDVGAFEAAQVQTVSIAKLRAELSLGDSEVVLTVSRLTVQKGIPTLLEAAAIVHAVRPGVRFLLVGPRESEGPFAVDQASIDRYAPYVIALGARSDVPALLGLADVFACPTEYREGIPRVLLEAGLAGVPMVATRVPGCDDVVVKNWNGHLVPQRDPRALAAAILDLLQDPARARAMGQRSIELVRREFDLNVVADRYADLYRQLLSTGRSSDDQTVPSHDDHEHRAANLHSSKIS
ncbi:MAG TPA: glycosyltransferase [Xanthobacteraceae bacterium]|nr:glycosyltransferase [Xanthobacteraceae bacterium]